VEVISEVEKEVEVTREVEVEKVVTAVPEPEQITMTVATDWNSGPRKEFYDAMTVHFQEMHPNVTVEVWHMGGGGSSGPGGMADIVRAQILTGTAADVIQGMSVGSLDFATPYLLDLTDIAAGLGWDRKDYYYNPAQSYSADGKLRVLPFNVAVTGWMYNKTMFEEEGLAEPTDDWDWNDLVEAARALTKPETGQFGVRATGPGVWTCGAEHMWAAGATWFNKDWASSGMCKERGPEMFEAWIDLIYKDKVSPQPGEIAGMLSGGVTNPFASGKIGMFCMGLQATGDLMRQIGDRFVASVMPTPKDPETGLRTTQEINDGHAVFVEAGERGTATYAVEYIMEAIGDFGQEIVVNTAPCFPTNKKWAHSEEMLEPPPLNRGQILTNSETYEPMPLMWCEHWGEANRAFRAEYDKAWTGEIPARECLAAACQAFDAALAPYKNEIKPWPYDFGFPLEGLSRANSEYY